MTRDGNHSRISSLLSVGSFKPRSSSPAGAPTADDDLRPTSRGRGLRTRSRSREPRSGSRPNISPPRSDSQGLRATRSSTALNMPDTDRPLRLSSLMTDRDLPPLPGALGLGTDGQQLSFGAGDLGSPLAPPPPIAGFGERSSSAGGSRAGSRHRPESSVGSFESRPMSRVGSSGLDAAFRPMTPTGGEAGKLSKRKNWMSGMSGKAPPQSYAATETTTSHLAPNYAFVVAPTGRIPYDTALLVGEKPLPELWNEQGDLMVHLYDKATSQGPSFRLNAEFITASRNFMGQSNGADPQRQAQDIRSHLRNLSLGGGNSPPRGSGQQSQPMSRSSSAMSDDDEIFGSHTVLEEQGDGLHLYLQLSVSKNSTGNISMDSLECLVRIRNLFAFLVGQVLVGTPTQPTLFALFLNIAIMLKGYEFTNIDGTSYGEATIASFLGYVEDLRLADVRASREKTIEALVLGERMKCWPLYNEGYVHLVGKYNDVINLKTPVMAFVSDTTRQRLDKSALDLDSRLKAMKGRLEAFEFPSLFAGVLASSTTSKAVDTKAWKTGFVNMRKQALGIYRQRFGSWPPKAKSKKNDFEGSGLNRVVTQELYQDFSDLYDLLVDRTRLTTRSIDGHDVTAGDHDHPAVLHLRKFMSEFDRSSPPVLPPVPYDIPLMPQMETVRRDFASLNVRKQVKERSKKATDDEINMALMASYNRDAVKATPFLTSFMAFERANAHGKTFDEIIDARVGQWIFLYVMIQCLPLLAIDAPDLRCTQGVEYFLCEAPKGNPPWVTEDPSSGKRYYSISGAQGIVTLPADVVEHGVEGTYLRSHCWQVASEWSVARSVGKSSQLGSNHPSFASRMSDSPVRSGHFSTDSYPVADPLPPPPGFGTGAAPGSRPGSMHGGVRHSATIGLEELSAPPPLVDPERGHMRRISTPDPTRSFDAILASAPQPTKKKR